MFQEQLPDTQFHRISFNMEKELEIDQKPPLVDGKQTIPLSRKLCIGRGHNKGYNHSQ